MGWPFSKRQALCTVLTLQALGFYYMNQHSQRFISPEESIVCVVREGGIKSEEGMGSFLQHIKSSIILAEILGVDLDVRGISKSTHGYNLSRELNFKSCAEPDENCRVNPRALLDLLPGICSGELKKSSTLRRLNIEGCGVVHHVVPKETLENFNDCLGDYYRKLLTRVSLEKSFAVKGTSECARVGVHIRWGDLARSATIHSGIRFDRRTLSIAEINRAISNIAFYNCECTEINLYLKGSPGIHAGTFAFNYTVIDSGDDFDDLLHYMSNDVLIQGISSYPILAAFASRNKFIITNSPESRKYDQSYRYLNHIYHYNVSVPYNCSAT